MPKEDYYSQFENESGPNESPRQTQGRVLKRLILEVLPQMKEWGENKNSLTRKVLEETLKNEKNYSEANEEDWRDLLEEFLDKNLELIILKNPLSLKEVLGKIEKNPLVKRAIEVGGKKMESSIIIGWHQEHGALALSTEDILDNKNFPNLKSYAKMVWPQWADQSETSLRRNNEDIILFGWDKKNFNNFV